MSRYETFVIRLWMEDQVGLGHGEIRHVRSGTGRHFRQVDEALEFVRGIARSSLSLDDHYTESDIERMARDIETDF